MRIQRNMSDGLTLTFQHVDFNTGIASPFASKRILITARPI